MPRPDSANPIENLLEGDDIVSVQLTEAGLEIYLEFLKHKREHLRRRLGSIPVEMEADLPPAPDSNGVVTLSRLQYDESIGPIDGITHHTLDDVAHTPVVSQVFQPPQPKIFPDYDTAVELPNDELPVYFPPAE